MHEGRRRCGVDPPVLLEQCNVAPAPACECFRLGRLPTVGRFQRQAPLVRATPRLLRGARKSPNRHERAHIRVLAHDAFPEQLRGSVREPSTAEPAGGAVEQEHPLDKFVPGDDIGCRPGLEPAREAAFVVLRAQLMRKTTCRCDTGQDRHGSGGGPGDRPVSCGRQRPPPARRDSAASPARRRPSSCRAVPRCVRTPRRSPAAPAGW